MPVVMPDGTQHKQYGMSCSCGYHAHSGIGMNRHRAALFRKGGTYADVQKVE